HGFLHVPRGGNAQFPAHHSGVSTDRNVGSVDDDLYIARCSSFAERALFVRNRDGATHSLHRGGADVHHTADTCIGCWDSLDLGGVPAFGRDCNCSWHVCRRPASVDAKRISSALAVWFDGMGFVRHHVSRWSAAITGSRGCESFASYTCADCHAPGGAEGSEPRFAERHSYFVAVHANPRATQHCILFLDHPTCASIRNVVLLLITFVFSRFTSAVNINPRADTILEGG